MRQAAAALFGAGFTVAACYAAGSLLIHLLWARFQGTLRRNERIPLAFVLGAACLHLAIFAILALHLGYWPVLVALLAAVIAASIGTGAWSGVRTDRGQPAAPLSKALLAVFGSCAGVFGILYLANAWAPEVSSDGAGYHLALVARALRDHGMDPLPNNFYGTLSAGVEMLFVPAFAIGRHSAAALVHFAFAVALALAMLAYGRRIGKPWAGAAGALLTFASPVVGIAGTSAYVDAATAAIVFAVFYWTEIWDEHREEQGALGLLIPVGLLAGYAYAAKYTASLIAIYALGFVALRAKRLRPVLLVAGCALLMAGPWIARNWIWYQNPVAPFGNALFPNPYVHVHFEREYGEFLRSYGMPSRRPLALALEATIHGQYIGGIVGPAFLLLPLALAALRYRAGRRLLLAGALVLSVSFANIGARFLIPGLPFLSLALGLALGEAAPFLAALMLFHAAASWPPVLNRYVNPECWRLVRFPYRAALRITPPEEFLHENSYGYDVARMIETQVPAGEVVLSMEGIPNSYTTREIRVNFQSASNESLADSINMGWYESSQPTMALVFQFPERKTRRMRVTQTAQAQHPDQWSVHELRFYYRGQELARRPEWRLRAWPNPWDVQLAFDNSLATRWRSAEVAGPGMYLDADFGREESVDEVRLVKSSEFEDIRLQLEVMSPASTWEKIADSPRQVALQVPPGIRRMATYEMHARGVHYLLLFHKNYGAQDFADDPEAWGLKLIGQNQDARLYRTIW